MKFRSYLYLLLMFLPASSASAESSEVLKNQREIESPSAVNQVKEENFFSPPRHLELNQVPEDAKETAPPKNKLPAASQKVASSESKVLGLDGVSPEAVQNNPEQASLLRLNPDEVATALMPASQGFPGNTSIPGVFSYLYFVETLPKAKEVSEEPPPETEGDPTSPHPSQDPS